MANPDIKPTIYGTSISDMIMRTERNNPHVEIPPSNPVFKGRTFHTGERALINREIKILPPHYELTKGSCAAQDGGPRRFLSVNGRLTEFL